MLRHLLCGQGGLTDSASKTHTPPANLRGTPLCHPDHHLKRKKRWQAVGLVRAPLKRMAVGLGAACQKCCSVCVTVFSVCMIYTSAIGRKNKLS